MPGDSTGGVILSGTSQAGLQSGVSLSRQCRRQRGAGPAGVLGAGARCWAPVLPPPRTGGVGWESCRGVLIGRVGDEDVGLCCHQGDEGATARRRLRTGPSTWRGPAPGS